MNIVGFNFTKIAAERRKAVTGKINVNNNIALNDVREAKIGLGSDRSAVRIRFVYRSEFQPGIAVMQMEGDVLVLEEKKRAEGLLKVWEKEKKLDPEVAQRVVNHVIERCSIQALLLAKDLNLPSPVRMPRSQLAPSPKAQEPAKETGKTAAKKKAKK